MTSCLRPLYSNKSWTHAPAQELYSRDGIGTMISTDFYEGIRKAGPGDVDAIVGLLQPLERAGILVARSRQVRPHRHLRLGDMRRANRKACNLRCCTLGHVHRKQCMAWEVIHGQALL